MSRQELIKEIAIVILESVNIHDISAESLTEKTVLIGEDLGLDSVDMLSCIVALEHKYKISIADADEGRKIFSNLGTIADYITKQRQTQA